MSAGSRFLPHVVPAQPATEVCHDCALTLVLQPPPVAPNEYCRLLPSMSLGPFSFHTVSPERVPLSFRYSVVPPTATTVFSAAGISGAFDDAPPSLMLSQSYMPWSPV